MPATYVRTNLGVCGREECDCCWVDMRVCAGCLRGPLSESEDSCGSECPGGGLIHLCPPRGSGEMACCGNTPLEVPPSDRITLDADLVTCKGNQNEGIA